MYILKSMEFIIQKKYLAFLRVVVNYLHLAGDRSFKRVKLII